MKIDKIKLYNFSSFEGENTFDFSNDEPRKNIILIGGKNGAGKTSLFTAIKIALYGPLSYGYVGINSHYISRIKDLINSRAFQQDKVQAGVQITIGLNVEREIRTYVITRKWNYTNQKLEEEYNVEENGNRLSDQKLYYFQNYLQGIIPPDLFEFFLFDGEEVGNIFSTASYNKYVKNAVFTLCGMDIFEIIRKFTKNYVAKSSGGGDKSLYTEYEKVRAEADKLTVRYDMVSEQAVKLQARLDELDIQMAELETAFKNAGGITREERENLDLKMSQAEAEKNEAAMRIKMFVEGMMPFYIVKDFAKSVSRQLDLEERGSIYEYIKKSLNGDDLVRELGTRSEADKSTVQSVIEAVFEKFKPEGYEAGSSTIFGLSKEDTDRVKAMISSLGDFDSQEMIDAVNRKAGAVERITEINKVLRSAMADEDAVQFAERENRLLKECQDTASSLRETQAEAEEIKVKLEQLTSEKDRLLDKIKKDAQNQHVYELSSGLSSMMETFLNDKALDLRKKLENLVIKNLNHIYRKNNLIAHVEITENFQFNLYQDAVYREEELIYLIRNLGTAEFVAMVGTEGKKRLTERYGVDEIRGIRRKLEKEQTGEEIKLYKRIELDRLSKGERQIFILALYWAIIELSGKDIPFIIDTPYARIDANHRKEISEKFFPNISRQVIILSTDEEINEEYYRILKPYIAREYLLVNDANQNRTSVETHYFFEEQANDISIKNV